MEPFSTLMMTAVGIGLQAYGAISGYSAAEQYTQASVKKIGLERDVEGQKRQAMELDARRKSLQTMRQAQQARSAGLAAATNQGAGGDLLQGGNSGYAGGQAQVRGDETTNLLGINQNLTIGRNIFDLNSKISDQSVAQAYAQQSMQQSQGFSQLGTSLVGSAGAFGRLTSGGVGGGGSPYRGVGLNPSGGMSGYY